LETADVLNQSNKYLVPTGRGRGNIISPHNMHSWSRGNIMSWSNLFLEKRG